MEAELINILLVFLLLITILASLLFHDQWQSIKRKNEALQKKVNEQYEKVQNAEKEATKERLKNIEIKAKLKSISEKYDFMRTNDRKFNVGDIVGKFEVIEVDVKTTSLVDTIVFHAKTFFNTLFKRQSHVEKPKVGGFIYKVKQSESWLTEAELENHSNSVTIPKRKYKKRTTKKK